MHPRHRGDGNYARRTAPSSARPRSLDSATRSHRLVFSCRAPLTGVVVFVVPANAKLGSIQYLPDPALRGALFFDAA